MNLKLEMGNEVAPALRVIIKSKTVLNAKSDFVAKGIWLGLRGKPLGHKRVMQFQKDVGKNRDSPSNRAVGIKYELRRQVEVAMPTRRLSA